jgi:hypothetical protein
MESKVVATLAILAATVLPLAPAQAQLSCFEHRAACESVCTPSQVAYYYFGSLRRCTASCEPRMNACLRTGVWVDLERLSTGGTEYATPF